MKYLRTLKMPKITKIFWEIKMEINKKELHNKKEPIS